MIVVSMALVLAGVVTLLLGVLGVGDEPLLFVYASIGACVLAAVFLVTGVLRSRPSRTPTLVDHPHRPSWAGARTSPDVPPPAARPSLPGAHVQVLPGGAVAEAGAAVGDTPAADDDAAEHARFVDALAGLGLDRVQTERLRGRFATVEALRRASVEELVQVPGIPPTLAQTIASRLRTPA